MAVGIPFGLAGGECQTLNEVEGGPTIVLTLRLGPFSCGGIRTLSMSPLLDLIMEFIEQQNVSPARRSDSWLSHAAAANRSLRTRDAKRNTAPDSRAASGSGT